jgi:integrase
MNAFSTRDESALFDVNGERKYLTRREAQALLAVANKAAPDSRLFCSLLHYTGCRISEGLGVTRRHLDAEMGRVIFRTLKRRKTVYRGVPVPTPFLGELMKFAAGRELDERLFPWCRQTGYRRIRAMMVQAGIAGVQATPKAMRHGYACHAIERGLPESLVGRLLGHSSPKSTRVYTFVLGPEERAMIERMWKRA